MICGDLSWTLVRKSLFSVEPQVQRGYDQETLSSVAWPAIRESAAIYDSYHCNKVEDWTTLIGRDCRGLALIGRDL